MVPNRTTPNGKGIRTMLQMYAALAALAVLGVISAALADFTWQPAWFLYVSPVLGGLVTMLQNKLEDSK